MNKSKLILLAIMTVLLSVVSFPQGVAFADVANGTYNVNYEIKEASGNNTSIANGYFVKPAKLIVENGTKTIQLTVTNSEWIKSLSGPNGAVTVVSEDKATDKRTVKFTVGDVYQPIKLNMHIVVPKEAAGMEYDHVHTAQLVMDTSSLKKAEAPAGKNDSSTDTTQGAESTEGETNPPTGDNTSIMLYVMLLIGSAGAMFAVWKLRPTRD